MKRTLSCLVVASLFVIVHPVWAWNPTGHYVIASMAYDELKAPAKGRVDALLKLHPDYQKWIAGVAPALQSKMAFIKAAGWPDDIKSDARFYTDGSPVTPNIQGLPKGSSNRHEDWHFTNLPFSNDGTRTKPAAKVNIQAKLEEFQKLATMDKTMQVYALPWILHLIGDVHQPLHAIALFRRDLPNGDRGGNLIVLKGGQKLHAYWDGRLGSLITPNFISATAATIAGMHPAAPQLDMSISSWVNESFARRTQVYGFSGTGSANDPAVLSDNYSNSAKTLAFERAALAAHRLAKYLTDNLK